MDLFSFKLIFENIKDQIVHLNAKNADTINKNCKKKKKKKKKKRKYNVVTFSGFKNSSPVCITPDFKFCEIRNLAKRINIF